MTAVPIVHERGVRASEPAHGLEVVGRDRLDDAADGHELRPACRLIASGQHEVCVGELRGGGIDRLRVKLRERRERSRFTGPRSAQQILGLVFQLTNVRMGWEFSDRHDEPP